MRSLAKAYGIRLEQIAVPRDAAKFMANVLAGTRQNPAPNADPGSCDPATPGGPAFRFAAIHVTEADGTATFIEGNEQREWSVLLLHYVRSIEPPRWLLRLFSRAFIGATSLPITAVCATL